MALETTDLTPRIGTQVKLDKRQLLSGDHATEIRRLLEQRGVVLFRDIDISDEEEIAFAATLGKIRIDYDDNPMLKVTMDDEHTRYGDYFRSTQFWHIDGTHEDVLPLASMLVPRVLAPAGTGQTEFANTYAAYEDLSDADKRRCEGIRLVHTKLAGMRAIYDNPTDEQLRHYHAFPVKSHPLVWQHQSGRKSLIVSLSADWVEGMEPDESAEFLAWIRSWVEQRRYVYAHEWRMGDLLIWDNTGTMHRARPFDKASGRRLHRVTLEGVESVQPVRKEPLAA
jgi:alpha-ketoglutarate-dependent taurine dioxygenase